MNVLVTGGAGYIGSPCSGRSVSYSFFSMQKHHPPGGAFAWMLCFFDTISKHSSLYSLNCI